MRVIARDQSLGTSHDLSLKAPNSHKFVLLELVNELIP